MNPLSMPEKPLVVSMNYKDNELQAKPVFFFERRDGSTFATEEAEAWGLYARNRNVKLVGTGDGRLFRQAVIEAREIFKTKGLQAAQEHIREGEKKELEQARLTIKPPRNFDKFGNGAHLLS